MDKNRPMQSTPPANGGTAREGSGAPRMWMGIGAVALIVVLGLLFIVPGAEDGADNRSRKVETTPAPNVTPK